jgi:FemAB-related protein (PEP-CTERM system-associated)
MTVVENAPNKATIDALKLEQKKLSRRIGQAKKQGEDPAPLLAQIQAISAKIKTLESTIKTQMHEQSAHGEHEVSCDPGGVFSLKPILSTGGVEERSKISPGEITIEYLDVQSGDVTDVETYLAQHPGSTPYHLPSVLRAIIKSFGHQTCYLVATTGKKHSANKQARVVGILPVVQIKSKLFGNYCISMPFFNYGGVLVDSVSVADRLLAEAKRWAVGQQAGYVEYRYSGKPPADLPSRSDKVSFYLSLPETAKALRQQFKSKLRSQIKKAESYSHDVRHGGEALLGDFYRVFSENMRDLGTPVYSKDFFHQLAEALGDRMSVCVVYYDNKPAAAAVLIGHKKRLEIPWASTLRRHNPKSVNMLLYWYVLSWAIEQGYSCFDFGRCSPDAGTYKFKAQWGATALPLTWDYHLIGGSMPELNTQNKKFSVLIAMWKKLPLWVANLVGPHIVKYLP